MTVSHSLVRTATCAAVVFWSSSVFSQSKGEEKPKPTKPALVKPIRPAKPSREASPDSGVDLAGDKPAAGEDMAKMMEVWKNAATPGEFHAKLNPLVGKWTFTTKARMSREQPWEESTGKAEYRWGLGNRVLYHEVKADPGKQDAMMGGPFEGFGMTGYDNTAKKYYNVWADSMGTGVMMSFGEVDDSGKSFTYTGVYDDPVVGKKSVKSVLKIAGDDKIVFEMYDRGPYGKEYMNLEVTYVRQK